MTAVASAPGRAGTARPRPARVPWHRLIRATGRQHRGALVTLAVLAALGEVAILGTGIRMHEWTTPYAPWASDYYYSSIKDWLFNGLQAFPVLAGMFLGVPLVTREAETGTTRMSWTQDASRTRLLLARIAPVAACVAAAGWALSVGYEWWLGPRSPFGYWDPAFFGLHALPYIGWAALGFAIGAFLGALAWRTVPAMAATIACYAALAWIAAEAWRKSYLPPLRYFHPARLQANGTWAWANGPDWPRSAPGPGAYLLDSYAGNPAGQVREGRAPGPWMAHHHIGLWQLYQPASRFGPFQWIEFGWTFAVAAVLIAATVILIRRRAA